MLVYFLVWAVVLIIFVSVFWTQFRGALWVPTPQSTVRKMLKMADVGPGDVVYDLGSGDGRVIITAARQFGARAVGIEVDPLRYLWTQLAITVFRLRGQVKVVWGDFFNQDLSRADVVTVYLQQETNLRLMNKLMHELRPGTRVVSHTFTFPGWQIISRDEKAQLYVYKI
jgi:predicted RNA methylase